MGKLGGGSTGQRTSLRLCVCGGGGCPCSSLSSWVHHKLTRPKAGCLATCRDIIGRPVISIVNGREAKSASTNLVWSLFTRLASVQSRAPSPWTASCCRPVVSWSPRLQLSRATAATTSVPMPHAPARVVQGSTVGLEAFLVARLSHPALYSRYP